MSIVQDVEVQVSKVIQKGVVSLVKLVVSWLMAGSIIKTLQGFGVQVDAASLTLALTAGINTLLAMARNWLKTKYPGQLGWL